MRVLRSLIVDDEPLARSGLKALLADLPEVEVVGEAADGREAIAAMRALRPDLLFLDVRMPELDGLQVVETLTRGGGPLIIFTSAYDAYAINAFRASAVDYLLKPIDPAQLREAVARARRAAGSVETEVLARSLLDAVQVRNREQDERIAVRRGDRIHLVRIADVDWVESAGNYGRLHAGKDSFLVRATMQSLTDRLTPHGFTRIHRRFIVRLDRISQVCPGFGGQMFLVLHDGTRLEMQRPFAERVMGLIGR